MDLLTRNKLLTQARKLIGTSYNIIDCSHFVNKAYSTAGMPYPYSATKDFVKKSNKDFELIGTDLATTSLEPGDVIVFNGHMGLWDPEGCSVLGVNQQCKRLKNDAPFLSSTTTNNHGPDFGRLNWWTGSYSVYRWAN
jgi:hypothetical protein